MFFFLSILILFFCDSAVLLYLSNRDLGSVSAELYEEKAQRIRQLLDTSLFVPLSSIVFDHLVSLQNSSVLNFLLYDKSQSSRELSIEIARQTLSMDWLQSIIVYREDGRIVSDFEAKRAPEGSAENTRLWGAIDSIRGAERGSGWLARGDGCFGPDSSLAYFIKYPIIKPSRNRGGIIYIVDTAFFAREITKIIDPAEESIIISDEAGKDLFRCGRGGVPEWVRDRKPDDPQKAELWKDPRSDWQVLRQPLSDQRLSLSLAVSSTLLRKNLLYTQRFAIVLTVLFIASLGVYLAFITRLFQDPLAKIMDALSEMIRRGNAPSPKRPGIFEADRIVEENRNLIIYRFIVNMVTGGLDRSDFAEICEIVGLRYYKDPLYLILVEQDPAELKETSWEEREARRDQFLRWWNDVLPADRAVSIRYPAGSLICLFFPPPGQGLPLESFRAFTSDHRSNVAFSNPLAETLDLPRTYATLAAELDKRLVRGYGNVFAAAGMQSPPSGARAIEPLKRCLMCDRYDDFTTLMQKDIRELAEGRDPPLIIRDYFVSVVGLIDETYQKKNRGERDEALSYLAMREELEELQSVSDMQHWVEGKIGALKHAFRYVREDDHRELFERIQAYIAAAPGKDLSQSTVAEHFGISTGFLCRLFREFSPAGFGPYLKERKLHEAAKRIREQEGLSVAELAQVLGYSSAAYFSRQFKAQYGVLPHEYARQLPKVDLSGQ